MSSSPGLNHANRVDRLYNLLPAIYRVRDAEQGEPLRALLAVMAEELNRLEDDVDELYENWFIETCAEWVVPYIGDLLGVRPLLPVGGGHESSLRAYIANTLAYRRRKGTLAVLEQLARDVTGWPAKGVEFFNRLATTQHVNHIRPQNLGAPDLRRTGPLELLGTPFEQAAYTGEVRRITSRRGKYNLPNVGLFLWRLQPYFVEDSTARPVSDPPDGRYTFNPLGLDAPLFNRERSEAAITSLAEEVHLPVPLRRRALYDETEALRQSIADGRARPVGLYLDENPVFTITELGAEEPVPAEEILICDLHDEPGGDWRRPPAVKTYTTLDASSDPPVPVEVELPIRVAVDPQRGRLAFPAGVLPDGVEVSSAAGFSGDLGGGPYPRREAAVKGILTAATWRAEVGQRLAPVPGEVFNTLAEAIAAWKEQPPGSVGVILLRDSRTYAEGWTGAGKIEVPGGSRLAVLAANGARPHLLGSIEVQGTAGAEDEPPGELLLEGLLVEGALQVLPGALGRLQILHSTLVPGLGGLQAAAGPERLGILRSISGTIGVPEAPAEIVLQDSIIDGQGGPAVDAPEAALEIQACTLFGTAAARSLEAGNSIFTAPVTVERRQAGCVRFSSMPSESRTPRRYRCQPDLALSGIDSPAGQEAARLRLAPQFTATGYGNPAYAQLSLNCAEEIRTGAEDGAEMGAFWHLKQPQREANLRLALDEYLRFGLEAGIFFVT